jgi:hypothetical protein
MQTTSISELALQYAISQLGQCEAPKGSNKGPMVDKYLESVGLKPGYAWCQGFVRWCYEQAANELKVKNPVVLTAGVRDCWNKTPQSAKRMSVEIIRRPELIMPGNQGIMFTGGTRGHTFLIEKVDASTGAVYVHTIEGNSNDDGSREGYEVVRHVRPIGSMNGIIRY